MKTVKTILKVIYNLLFAFLIISSAFILLTSFDVLPNYNFYVVLSGSMKPAIHAGSIVATNKVGKYIKGDIVTVMINNNPENTYTHRIIKINKEEDSTTYTTKGDANNHEDTEVTTKDSILGKVFLTIPLVGYPVHFAKSPTGFLLMVIFPSVIIVSSELNTIKEEGKKLIEEQKKKKKKSKKKEDKKKEEKEKVEEVSKEPKKKEKKDKKEIRKNI